MTDSDNRVDRRVFLRLLSVSAMGVASGSFLASCGGGGGGSSNSSSQIYNYPNVTFGSQAGSLSVTTQSNGLTTGAIIVTADGGSARRRTAARPHDAATPPSGTYAFSGKSTAVTGGFTMNGTATFTPALLGNSVTGPITLAFILPTVTTAGSFTFNFNGGTYPVIVPASNTLGSAQAGVPKANLIFNAITGITPPSDNPVDIATFIPAAIQVNFGPGDIPRSGIVQYHIYRDPEPAVLQFSANFNVPDPLFSELIPLPIFSPAASPAYDSLQNVPPISVQKPDPANNTNTPIQGIFYGGTVGSQLPILGTGLFVGERVRYRVEALYKNSSGNVPTYSLSAPVYSNYVTYLQPPLLLETDTTAYPHTASETSADNDVFGLSTGPTNIIVVFRAVYLNPNSTPEGPAGLKYVLDFSIDQNFSPGNTLRYVPNITTLGDNELFPRGTTVGPIVRFGGSGIPNSTTIDLTNAAAQAVLGNLESSHSPVYVRAGVRDIRDPDDSTFIYSTLDGSHYTDPVAKTYTLPAQLTPGGGNRDGSARRL